MSTIEELKKEIDSLKRKNKIFEQRLSAMEGNSDIQSIEEVKETKTKIKPSTFEADVGLKWFSKIGILALVIGIGFFIKYAFENNWLNHLTRIIIGVVIGLALIIGGELISKKEKYFKWGLTLAGGGFAITYFAVYSAYHFEEYKNAIGISQTMDIILLSIVVIAAILFSVKDNSKIIASEAFFLGFITSLLSKNFELSTLIYGLILTIGLIVVVLYKKWSLIGIGGLIATYLVYLFWYFDNINKFWISTTFLTTYFVVYNIQSFLLSSNKDKNVELQNVAITIINSLFFYILYYFQIRKSYPDYDGLLTLLVGIFYLVAYYITNVQKREKLSTTNLYLAILFITLTIPIQLNKEWITVIFALETVILTILSFKLDMKSIRYSSYAVGVVTVIKTLSFDTWRLNEFNISNLLGSTRFFSFLAAIIAFYFVALYLDKNKKALITNECFASDIYYWGGTLLLFFLILLEMEKFWISMGWTLIAAAVLVLGFHLKRKQFRLQGIILFGITILKVFLYDTRELDTLYRTISFIVLGIILLLASFIYTKYKDKLKDIL